MFNKTNFRISALLPKDGFLTHLHLTDQFTEVTNGHYLIRVDAIKSFNYEDLPKVDDIEPTVGPVECLVTADTAKAIEKAIPKMRTLPMLEHAWIGGNGNKDTTTFITTDLETETPITSINPQDVRYPKTDEIWPKGDPEFEIAFNPDYMSKLCQQYVKAGITKITLAIHGDKQAMKLTGTNTEKEQEVKALLMPMRS